MDQRRPWPALTLALVPMYLIAALLLFAALPAMAQPVPRGDELQVNSYTTGGQHEPGVGMAADGSFVVVWHSFGSTGNDDSERSIAGRRFDAAGSPLGDQFQINTYTTSFQTYPALTMAPNGEFLVVWRSNGSPGSDASGGGVLGQHFDSEGVSLGAEIQVNTTIDGSQSYPKAGGVADGRAVVVYDSASSGGNDDQSDSIQAQRFALPIFADGFESGDVGRWSTAIP